MGGGLDSPPDLKSRYLIGIKIVKRLGTAMVVFLLLLCSITGAGVFAGLRAWQMPGELPRATDIVIPHGGYDSTFQTLVDTGAIAPGRFNRFVFRAAIYLTRKDGQIHAAELSFPAHVSMKEALEILRHGHPVQHQLTIPEGLTAYQISALIADAPALDGEMPTIAEGSVLPETYLYLRGTSRADLVKRMQHAMETTLHDVWEKRDHSIELSSERDLLVLASIVEKETGKAEERPMVARVFLNRLATGMKLQSDPTTIYGLSDGKGALGRPLTHNDMLSDTAWNTYVTSGLPSGPICSPGREALESVTHPASGKALYFVAMPDGRSVFSETLGEHNRNVSTLRHAH